MKKLSIILLVLLANHAFSQKSVCSIVRPDSLTGIDASFSNRTDYINQNYGAYTANRAEGGTGQNAGSDEQDWRFVTKLASLSEIPANAIIDSAYVTFYENTEFNYFLTQGNNSAKFFLVTENWSEYGVTWNNQPAYDSSTYVSVASVSPGYDSVKLDITNLVAEIIEQDKPNYGFLYKLDDETPYQSVVFGSSDNSSIAVRPLWKVCYTVPPTCIYSRPDSATGIDASFSNRTDYINQNYGAYTANRAEGGTGQDAGSDEQDWRFATKLASLSDIPANAVIDSAYVTFYENTEFNYFLTRGNNSAKFFLVTENWSEYGVTWNNQPAYDSSTYVSVASVSSGYDSVKLDITNLVAEIIEQGKPNYGFLYKLDDETPYQSVVFGSSDNTNVSIRPLWKVCYTPSASSNKTLDHAPASFNQILLYPNPSTGVVYLTEYSDGVVYNSVGAEVLSFNSRKELNLSHLPKGVYYVKIAGAGSKKLILE